MCDRLRFLSSRTAAAVFSLLMGFIISLTSLPVAAADEESDDRVLVVFVFDKSCRISCDAVRPIFKQLKITATESNSLNWTFPKMCSASPKKLPGLSI